LRENRGRRQFRRITRRRNRFASKQKGDIRESGISRRGKLKEVDATPDKGRYRGRAKKESNEFPLKGTREKRMGSPPGTRVIRENKPKKHVHFLGGGKTGGCVHPGKNVFKPRTGKKKRPGGKRGKETRKGGGKKGCKGRGGERVTELEREQGDGKGGSPTRLSGNPTGRNQKNKEAEMLTKSPQKAVTRGGGGRQPEKNSDQTAKKTQTKQGKVKKPTEKMKGKGPTSWPRCQRKLGGWIRV